MANPLQSVFHALWVRWDRFLSGGRNDDPLYIYNRTLNQKLGLWLKIAAPCLLLVAAVSYGLFYRLRARDKAPAEMPADQVAAKMLPGLDKPMDLGTSRDFDIQEVHVEPGTPMKLVGAVRNKSGQVSGEVHMTFELLNRVGSRLGAVSTTVTHVPAHGSLPFALPLEQADAWNVIVLEIGAT